MANHEALIQDAMIHLLLKTTWVNQRILEQLQKFSLYPAFISKRFPLFDGGILILPMLWPNQAAG